MKMFTFTFEYREFTFLLGGHLKTRKIKKNTRIFFPVNSRILLLLHNNYNLKVLTVFCSCKNNGKIVIAIFVSISLIAYYNSRTDVDFLIIFIHYWIKSYAKLTRTFNAYRKHQKRHPHKARDPVSSRVPHVAIQFTLFIKLNLKIYPVWWFFVKKVSIYNLAIRYKVWYIRLYSGIFILLISSK